MLFLILINVWKDVFNVRGDKIQTQNKVEHTSKQRENSIKINVKLKYFQICTNVICILGEFIFRQDHSELEIMQQEQEKRFCISFLLSFLSP